MTSTGNNNQIDEKTLALISEMEKEIQSKDQEINQLKTELEFLKSQVLNKNRKLYGSSSEQLEGQQLLFNEAEKESDTKIDEPDIEEITYSRKKAKNHKKTKEESFANLETVVIEHKLDEAMQKCAICDTKLTVIGKKVTKKLAFEPAKLYVEEHITYTYACKNCEAESDEANIIQAPSPQSFLPKSMASSELLSHILYLKYSQALPLYRQENYFKMMNVELSRQILSNWVIKVAEKFQPFYELLKEELIKQSYIQADETPVKVLKENGKDARSQKYMWMYKSGNLEKPIILYDYQKTRSSACPTNFLKEFSGYLQTDGYEGYNKVENVKWISCLAHVRRKFFDIVKPLDAEAKKKSRAVIGLNYCTKLYNIEKDIKTSYEDCNDYYDKRYEIRLEKSAPVLDEFIDFVEKDIADAIPRSALGKALTYAKKQLPKLKIFLEDGSLEIDNNASERAVKSFVIGRKNWLFSNTPKGANASALIYSIIETAKANGLQIERYLTYIMNYIANDPTKDQESLASIMPWSTDLPANLKVQGLEKK